MPPSQRFEITREDAGGRLDRFLAVRMGLSRSQVRKLLASGAVKVGERLSDASSKSLELGVGEVVEVAAFTPPEEQEAAEEPGLALDVLAKGPGWVVVDKPAGMPVHPLREDERGTALNALIARHPELSGVGEGALRSGVVHRLDVDTSGALLFATEQRCWERLREAFRSHRVTKRYTALVDGTASEGEAEVLLYVAASRPAVVSVATDPRERRSWPTRTRWRVSRDLGDATLLEVEIETGFLHQIRATLAHLGHPILGDRIYAPESVAARAPRQLLHASHLAFEEVEASSPLPEDFARFL